MDINTFLTKHLDKNTDCKVGLEAYVNTLFMDEAVSQEGISEFIDSIKNYFFSGKPSVSNMSGGWFDRMSVLRKTLQTTYLDPNWINRRKFVHGNVQAIKFVEPLSLNGVWDGNLFERINTMLETMDTIQTFYKTKTIGWYNDIYPLVKNLNPGMLNYTDAFRLERILSRMDYPDFTYKHAIALGGAELTDLTITLKPSRTSSIPAMSQAEVVKAAEAMMDIGEAFDGFNQYLESIYKHPCYKKLDYLIIETEADVEVTDATGLNAELHRIFNTMQLGGMTQVYNEFKYLAKVIKALAMYIDASVR